jgi:hypothetical protein
MVKKFGEREGERKFFGSIMLWYVRLGLETTDTVEGISRRFLLLANLAHLVFLISV